ncbi:MAG: hypothetical protein JXR61_07505 [Prolixibacteraceae bacterium]|nr:hypothetical protein [Prolixibacteraceae bacterium]
MEMWLLQVEKAIKGIKETAGFKGGFFYAFLNSFCIKLYVSCMYKEKSSYELNRNRLILSGAKGGGVELFI